MSKKDLEYFVRRGYELYNTIPSASTKENTIEQQINTIELGRFVREAAILRYEYDSYKASKKKSKKLGASFVITFIGIMHSIGLFLFILYTIRYNQQRQENKDTYSLLIKKYITIVAIFGFLPYFIYSYYFQIPFSEIGKTKSSFVNDFITDHMKYEDEWKKINTVFENIDYYVSKDPVAYRYSSLNPKKRSIYDLGQNATKDNHRDKTQNILKNYSDDFQKHYIHDNIYQGVTIKNALLDKDKTIKALEERIKPFQRNGYHYDEIDSTTKKLLYSLFINIHDSCPTIYAPVCSEGNGYTQPITYKNLCEAQKYNAPIDYYGECNGNRQTQKENQKTEENYVGSESPQEKHQQLKQLQNTILMNPFPQNEDIISRIPSEYTKAHNDIVVYSITDKRQFINLTKDTVKQYVLSELEKSVNDKTYIAGMRHNISKYIDIVFIDSNRRISNENTYQERPGHVPFITIYTQLIQLRVGDIRSLKEKWKNVNSLIEKVRTQETSDDWERHINEIHYQFVTFIVSYIIILCFIYGFEITKSVEATSDRFWLKKMNYICITLLISIILINIPYRWYITRESERDIKKTNTQTLQISTQNTYNYLEEFLNNHIPNGVSDDKKLLEIPQIEDSLYTIEDYFKNSEKQAQSSNSSLMSIYKYYKEATLVSMIYKEKHNITTSRQSKPFPMFEFLVYTVLLITVIGGILWLMTQHNPVSIAKHNSSPTYYGSIDTTLVRSIMLLGLLILIIISLLYNMIDIKKTRPSVGSASQQNIRSSLI